MKRGLFNRAYVILLFLLACGTFRLSAQAQENPADKTLLDVELMLPSIATDPLLAQRWRKVFEGLGESVRIRQPLPNDKPEIEETQRGPFRLVKVIGKIERDGSVVFAEKSFTFDQAEQLKEWLDELKTYGAQGSPAGKPLWGLSESQFREVYDQLKAPVEVPLLGTSMDEAIRSIPLKDDLKLTFHSTAEPLRKESSDQKVPDEIQGLSAGTALAYLLSQSGLGFRPLRTPAGDVQLNVQPLADIEDPWPVGWPFPEGIPRNQIVPSLFTPVEVGFPETPLNAVLDAIEQRSNVRILVDFRTCHEKQLDPSDIAVSFPRKKTAWSLVISSAVVRSKLMMHYRQDEAGTGFIFVAPFAHYVPGKERTRILPKSKN